MLTIVHGDLLSAQADALILTIDGAKRGMEGNIARAFARRWEDAWIDIEDQTRYPIPLGRTVAAHPDNECNFPLVLLASTLYHIEQFTDAEKQGIVRSALHEAIVIAQRNRARRIATAVMTGGWRLGLGDALTAMFAVLRPIASPESESSISLHLLARREFEASLEAARRCRIPFISTDEMGKDLGHGG
jgi:hypothetical protein